MRSATPCPLPHRRNPGAGTARTPVPMSRWAGEGRFGIAAGGNWTVDRVKRVQVDLFNCLHPPYDCWS